MTTIKKRLSIATLILSLALIFPATPAFAQNKIKPSTLNNLSKEIDTLRSKWKVPGTAVGIIMDGKTIFAEGFGYRDREQKKPVTTQTLFRIGSCSKAFTAFSIAQLIDKDKISWDQPIIQSVPQFKLNDRWATENASFEDFLLHRTGIGRRDLLTHFSDFSMEEIFNRVQYIPLSTDFRSGFRYSNLNYIVAAHVLEKLTGKKWEDLVKDNIFTPLGMNRSCFTAKEMQKSSDYAKPYVRRLNDWDNDVVSIPHKKCDTFSASGGIISNLEEMLNWVQMHLNNGAFEKKQLVSQRNFIQMLAPTNGLGYSPSGVTEASAYGMGWYINFYRGRYLVQHSGILNGYCAMVSFMPKENIGVVVLTNLKMHSLHNVINNLIYDRLLGVEPFDFSGYYEEKWQEILTFSKKESDKLKARRVAGAQPSHALTHYTGIYKHPCYGTIGITRGEHGLQAGFNGVIFIPMRHYHYDVWLTSHPLNTTYDSLTLHFLMDETGEITELAVDQGAAMDKVVFPKTGP